MHLVDFVDARLLEEKQRLQASLEYHKRHSINAKGDVDCDECMSIAPCKPSLLLKRNVSYRLLVNRYVVECQRNGDTEVGWALVGVLRDLSVSWNTHADYREEWEGPVSPW